MDEPGTVFCLWPKDDFAEEIVDDPANRERRRVAPNDPSKRFLRIGLEKQSKVPPYLVKFGRMRYTNDVILGKRWSKNDQCYFDFNQKTGELLLHDISKDGNSNLYDKDMPQQIWKSPRKCVVLLTREWFFEIGCARFRLIPRRAESDQDKAAFADEKLAFVQQPVPEGYEGTYEGTLERLCGLGLPSSHASTSTYNPHNTRLITPHQPKSDDEIRYTQLRPLGKGSQAEVHEVVNMHNGEHYACKVIPFKELPQWGIYREKDFKIKIEAEVNLIKKAKHVRSPYSHRWLTTHSRLY